MILWSMIVLLLIATLAALIVSRFIKGRDTLATRDAFDANVFQGSA